MTSQPTKRDPDPQICDSNHAGPDTTPKGLRMDGSSEGGQLRGRATLGEFSPSPASVHPRAWAGPGEGNGSLTGLGNPSLPVGLFLLSFLFLFSALFWWHQAEGKAKPGLRASERCREKLRVWSQEPGAPQVGTAGLPRSPFPHATS